MTRELLKEMGYRQWPDTLRQGSILWQKRIADEGEELRTYLNVHEATEFRDEGMRQYYTWDIDFYIERPDSVAMQIQWYCIPTDVFDRSMLATIEVEARALWQQFSGRAVR